MTQEHDIEEWQPTRELPLAIMDKCSYCAKEIEKLLEFTNRLPYKYGNKIVITFHQDFWGSNKWHIESFETGNYQLERGDDEKYVRWTYSLATSMKEGK